MACDSRQTLGKKDNYTSSRRATDEAVVYTSVGFRKRETAAESGAPELQKVNANEKLSSKKSAKKSAKKSSEKAIEKSSVTTKKLSKEPVLYYLWNVLDFWYEVKPDSDEDDECDLYSRLVSTIGLRNLLLSRWNTLIVQFSSRLVSPCSRWPAGVLASLAAAWKS